VLARQGKPAEVDRAFEPVRAELPVLLRTGVEPSPRLPDLAGPQRHGAPEPDLDPVLRDLAEGQGEPRASGGSRGDERRQIVEAVEPGPVAGSLLRHGRLVERLPIDSPVDLPYEFGGPLGAVGPWLDGRDPRQSDRQRLGYPPPVLEPDRQVDRVPVHPEGRRLADTHAVGVLAGHHEGALAGLAVEDDRTPRDAELDWLAADARPLENKPAEPQLSALGENLLAAIVERPSEEASALASDDGMVEGSIDGDRPLGEARQGPRRGQDRGRRRRGLLLGRYRLLHPLRSAGRGRGGGRGNEENLVQDQERRHQDGGQDRSILHSPQALPRLGAGGGGSIPPG